MPNDLRTAADAAREALAAAARDDDPMMAMIALNHLLAAVDERLAGDELAVLEEVGQIEIRWDKASVTIGAGDGQWHKFDTAVAALKWVRENHNAK